MFQGEKIHLCAWVQLKYEMVMKDSLKLLFLSSIAAMGLVACDVSVSAGGIEDRDAPKEIQNLAPLPDVRLSFAEDVVRNFYAENDDAILPLINDTVKAEFTVSLMKTMYRLKTDLADVEQMEYYGHGFGEELGMNITVVQFRLMTESGYDLIKVVMTAEPDCCKIAGLHVERKFVEKLFGD